MDLVMETGNGLEVQLDGGHGYQRQEGPWKVEPKCVQQMEERAQLRFGDSLGDASSRPLGIEDYDTVLANRKLCDVCEKPTGRSCHIRPYTVCASRSAEPQPWTTGDAS